MYKVSMGKHTNVLLDDNDVEEAKKRGINISELTRDALKKKLGKEQVEIEHVENCEFCGKYEEKASKENQYKGLTWLYPDERWICESCLKSKSARAKIGQ